MQDISYIYDPEGNITEQTDAAQRTIYFDNAVAKPKNTYEYDALYRLTKATGREHNSLANLSHSDFGNNMVLPEDGQNMRTYTQTYKYDELGNILQMSSQGVWTRAYKYNFAENNYLLGHDLESSLNNYEYDNHGNMTKMPHLQELKYDYANQLHDVTLDASGNKAFYVYDASGNRVRKVIEKGNITEERFYVGNYEYYTKTNNGTVEVERETVKISDDKQVIALIDNDIQSSLFTIRYQLTNHLDSASLELDHEANIISYEEYHPFGTTSYRSGRSEAEVSLKRYKYVFKELDNETGLYYYGMRYYAPWIARFISVDPLQFKYPYYTPVQYAGNKPISYIDLDGAEEEKSNKDETKAGRFFKSLWIGIIVPIGFLSELPGQGHYGHRIKEEDKPQAFPLTHDQNFQTMAEGIVLDPIIIIADAVNKPTAENFGKLTAMGVMMLVGAKAGKMGQFAKREHPTTNPADILLKEKVTPSKIEGVTGDFQNGNCGNVTNAILKAKETGMPTEVKPFSGLLEPKDVSTGLFQPIKNVGNIKEFVAELSKFPEGSYGAIHIQRGSRLTRKNEVPDYGHFMYYEINKGKLSIFETVEKNALKEVPINEFIKLNSGHKYTVSPYGIQK